MSNTDIICMLLVIILGQLINALVYLNYLNSNHSNKELKSNLDFLKKLKLNKKTETEQKEKPNWQQK